MSLWAILGIYLLVCLVFSLLYMGVNVARPWKYDKCNPYRRWCKRCGQQQSVMQYWTGASRWENVGMKGDESCPWHD